MRIEEIDISQLEEMPPTIPREVSDIEGPDIPVSQEPVPDFPLVNKIVEEAGPRLATATLTRTAVLATAAREIGYNVKSGAKYWEGVGKASWTGAPWCAAFVQWVFKVNGSWYPAPLPYYVPSFQSEAKKRGEWVSKGSPGDLVIYDWGTDGLGDHIGFLERYTAFGIQTIEGNTSSGNVGSQNNGGGVWRRIRNGGYIGFVHFKGYGQEIVVVDPNQFPLPKGHWYGPDDGTAYSHSGVRGYPDTENIKRIQTLVKTDIDGSYGPKTKSAVLAWETANNDTSSDGLVDVDTWNNMVEKGLPKTPGSNPTPPPAPKPPAPSSQKLVVDGYFGPATIKAFQKWLGTTQDSYISGQPAYVKSTNPGLKYQSHWLVGTGGSNAIAAHQKILKNKGLYKDVIDGIAGPNYWTASQKWLGTYADGVVSNPSTYVAALQRFLNRTLYS